MTDDVQRILGWEPRDCTDYVRDIAAPMPPEAPVTTATQPCKDLQVILGFFPDLLRGHHESASTRRNLIS
jgi:hypothetical protein